METTTQADACPVCSYNEWDPLEEVIVGRVEHAMIPSWLTIYRATVPNLTRLEDLLEKQKVPYPANLVDPARKSLEEFVRVLEGEGVKVRRPDEFEFGASYGSPAWSVRNGFCSANPRDVFLVVGNEIIEAPMPDRGRFYETWPYRTLLKEYFNGGARWVSAPKPQLLDDLYHKDFEASEEGEDIRFVLTEFEPAFDAADFMRMGKDLVAQKSHVTNDQGIEWMRRHLGEGFTIHEIESRCPRAMHIDTTLVPLAPGKVMVNPEFTDVDKLPEYFRSWDVLVGPKPDGSAAVLEGAEVISYWVNMNVLSLDEERVVVEKSQPSMIKAMKDWGFKPIAVDFKDFYPFFGSFHCATLDVRRRGELRSYA